MHLIQIENPAHLVGVIQTLATGSFEKKFGLMPSSDVVSAFGLVTQDLSVEQINTGLGTLVEMGFCPDAVLFRRWCLGQKTFTNADEVADSYIDKHGALSLLIRYLNNHDTQITTAIKEAYNECCHLWSGVISQQDQFKAEYAFKGHYEFIVKQAIRDKRMAQPYVPPIAIKHKHAEAGHAPIGREEALKILSEIQQRLDEVA